MELPLCAGVQFPVGAKGPQSLRWVPGSFPELKWSGRDVDYSLPSGAEVKNGWSYTSIPVYIHSADRDNPAFFNVLKPSGYFTYQQV